MFILSELPIATSKRLTRSAMNSSSPTQKRKSKGLFKINQTVHLIGRSANTEIASVRDQYKNEIKVLGAKMKLQEAELAQTQRKLAAKVQSMSGGF